MPTDHSADITQAISRFEAAWADGATPRLEEFIPQDGDDNVELVAELVAVDLERRLKAGEQIRVEDYLDRFPRLAAAPADVVSLIISEYQHRCRLNPALSADEYLERFPQYRNQLLAQLSANDETLIGGEQFATRSITPVPQGSADETADGLLRRMAELGLVSEQTIESRRRSLPADARQNQQLIDELLQRGDVTGWQLKQLRAGQKTFLLENGRYLLLDELGKGGMGTVYRARHVGLNRDVALKTIDPKQAKNSQLIGRFQREISVCAKLQHEHIVQAYDMGCHQGVHFLVLEYVAGADLASLIKRDGPMWPDEVAAVGLQIAAALVYAHGQGIVHRDIKPHNILLSTDGISKLLDMGLASNNADDGAAEALTSLTQTGMVLGTADYMPPEQAADLAKVDGRSDIYSLGATLYYLLTGRPPFPGGDMMSKMHRLANEEPAAIGQLRPDCPRELTDVIERMLAKRPEARYQSAVEVVQALQPLAAERIAGRHVMTRAVQTAAEAEAGTPQTATVAVTPFAYAANDTVATSFLRREKQSSLGKWLIGSAIAMPLLIGIGIWAASSSDNGTTTTDGSDPPDNTSNVSTDLNQPPSQVRPVQRAGHYGEILGDAWSADGRRLATVSNDGEIRIWDATDLRTLTVYQGHRAVPRGVIWLPDDRTVLSWDSAKQAHAWNAATGAKLYEIGLPVEAPVAVSAGGGEMAFRSNTVTVRWSIKQRKVLQFISNRLYDNLRYSASGKYLAGTINNTLEVLALRGSQTSKRHLQLPIQRIQRRPTSLHEFAFVDDTQLVMTADGSVGFWNLDNGELIRKLEVPKTQQSPPSHSPSYVGLAKDARSVVVWTDDGIQKIDLKTGRMTTHKFTTNFADAGPVGTLSRTADRQRIMVSKTASAILDFRNDSQREMPHVEIPIAANRTVDIFGGWLLYHGSTADGFDLTNAELFTDFPHENFVLPFIDPEGRLLLYRGQGSGNSHAHAEVWPVSRNAAEQQVFPDFEGLAEFQPHPNIIGNWAKSGTEYWRISTDQKRLRFWDITTGKVVRTVEAAEGESLYVATGSHLLVRRRKATDGVEFLIEKLNDNNESAAVSVVFDGNVQFSGVSADDRRLLVQIPSGSPRVIVCDTADGKLIANFEIPDDIAVVLSGSPLRSSHGQAYPAVELSRSGRYLLVYDRVYDLDAKSPQMIWKAPNHSAAFYTAGLLGDERHVVMRIGDRYEIWDWKNGKKHVTIFLLPETQWLFFNHATGCWNGSGSAFRHVRFGYRGNNGNEEWVMPTVYGDRAKWKNDPAKAGLADLQQK